MARSNDPTVWGWAARTLFWIGQTAFATLFLSITIGLVLGGSEVGSTAFTVVTVLVSVLLFRQVSKLIDDKLDSANQELLERVRKVERDVESESGSGIQIEVHREIEPSLTVRNRLTERTVSLIPDS